jgi:hypothetical protein
MNTKTAISEQVELSFLLKWILLSTIGWIVVSAIVWSVSLNVFNYPADTADLLTLLVFGVVGGTLGGISQWFVLRGRLPQLGSWACALIWIWSGFISYALGLLATTWLLNLESVVGLVALPLTGIPQWFVLRRYFSKAGWWLIVVPIGLPVSLVPVLYYWQVMAWQDYWFWVRDDIILVVMRGAVLGAIGGVLFGIFTAIALSVLLRSSDSPPHVDMPSNAQ